MSPITRPTREELAPLLAEATSNGTISEDEWRKRMATGISKVLKRDPLQYRCYGPYWWQVKACLIAQGVTRFGTTLDAEWLEKTDCGDPTTSLLAAYAYYSYAFDMGLRHANTHQIPCDDGELLACTLVDEEMETFACANTL